MSIYLEDYIPVVKWEGLNTEKAVSLGSTLAVTGAVSATALNASGLVKVTNPVFQQTITNIDTQNATPTIAQYFRVVSLFILRLLVQELQHFPQEQQCQLVLVE